MRNVEKNENFANIWLNRMQTFWHFLPICPVWFEVHDLFGPNSFFSSRQQKENRKKEKFMKKKKEKKTKWKLKKDRRYTRKQTKINGKSDALGVFFRRHKEKVNKNYMNVSCLLSNIQSFPLNEKQENPKPNHFSVRRQKKLALLD